MSGISKKKHIERRPFPIEGADRDGLRAAGALVVDKAAESGNVWLTYKGRGIDPTGGVVRELVGGMVQRWNETTVEPDQKPFIVTAKKLSDKDFPMQIGEFLAGKTEKKLLIVNDAKLFTEPGRNTSALLHTMANTANDGLADIVTLSPYSIRFRDSKDVVQPGTQEYYKHTVQAAFRVLLGEPGLIELERPGTLTECQDHSFSAENLPLGSFRPEARR